MSFLSHLCIPFQDVVTSGSSILETAKILRSQGLIVEQAVVLLNREQGGEENLRQHGVTLHSLATISKLMDVLEKHKIVDDQTKEKVLEFVMNNQVVKDERQQKKVEQMTLEARCEKAGKPLSRKILETLVRYVKGNEF